MALFVTFRLTTPARPPLANPAPKPPLPLPPFELTLVELPRLAQSFMQQYYPDWWTYFGKEGRQVVNAKVYLYGTKLTWQNAGAVYDSQGLQWKSADQMVEYIKTIL